MSPQNYANKAAISSGIINVKNDQPMYINTAIGTVLNIHFKSSGMLIFAIHNCCYLLAYN